MSNSKTAKTQHEIKDVIGYIRVSTDRQADDDRFGPEAQREQIMDYCLLNHYNIVDWVTDEGESGAKFRPGFDSIINGGITNPPVQAVIVAKSDRVARDIEIYFYYKLKLRIQNIQLISVVEDFQAFGKFAPILEAFVINAAAMERENITRRTMGGRKIKAAQGGYSGGRAPYGYHISDGQLQLVPEEAEVVKLIFDLRDNQHKPIIGIANTLNEKGIRTRKGKDWVHSTIQSILSNRKTYQGYYRYGPNGEWVEGQQEPILPRPESEN